MKIEMEDMHCLLYTSILVLTPFAETGTFNSGLIQRFSIKLS